MSLNNKILKAHHNKNLSLLVELYQEAADNALLPLVNIETIKN